MAHLPVSVVTARCIAVSTTQVMRSCLRASHRQTRQPVTADWNVSCPIQDGAGAFIVEEGWARQFSTSELQADLQPVDRLQGPQETSVGTPAASSARLCQLQPVPVHLQEGALH